MATRVTQAAGRTLAALQKAVNEPDGLTNRKAAESIVALRKQFRHEGQPDWAGRSPEYRDCIARLYREAGVPSDSGNSFQANIRYHLGNVLREVAPPEELQAIGLSTEGPLGRIRHTRGEKRPAAAKGRVKALGDPVAMTNAAIGIVLALRTMNMEGLAADVEPRLRVLINEALDTIAELHV